MGHETIRDVRKLFLNRDNMDEFIRLTIGALTEMVNWYTGIEIENNLKINPGDYKNVGVHNGCSVEEAGKRTIERIPEELPKQLTESLNSELEEIVNFLKNEIRFNENFMGQMHPSQNIASYAAGIAAKFVNGNTVTGSVSRATSQIEQNRAVRWLCEILGYSPEKASGTIVSGGTKANLTALVIARNRALFHLQEINNEPFEQYLLTPEQILDFSEKSSAIMENHGVAKVGMQAVKPKCVLYMPETAHYSLVQIPNFIGLGISNIRKIKTDKNHKIIIHELTRQIELDKSRGNYIIGIIGIAGTTEAGAVDDLESLAGIAEAYNLHFHIDAAHGGPFRMVRPNLFKGMERADTITVDPHKMLYSHYNAGALLVKNKEFLNLLKAKAGYLFDNGVLNIGENRIACSMGLESALQTYASLKVFGEEGLKALLNHSLELTQNFKKVIDADKDEVGRHIKLVNPEPDLNLLCFRYENTDLSKEELDRINKEAQRRLEEEGKFYFSSDNMSYRRGIAVLRAVMMNPFTTDEIVKSAYERTKDLMLEVKNEGL